MNTARSVTPDAEAELRARPAAAGAATRDRPTQLAAGAYATRPDPDERRRRLERERPRDHPRRIFRRPEGHRSRSDFARASSTSSDVWRWSRASLAAMIAT